MSEVKRYHCDDLQFLNHCNSCHGDVEGGYTGWLESNIKNGFQVYGCCTACTDFDNYTDDEFNKLPEHQNTKTDEVEK